MLNTLKGGFKSPFFISL